MEFKRQHIFDDILGGGSSTYHSAILTCYSFDPFFYANFFKPQLNARGICNQLVLIDANRLDEAKEDERFSFIPGVSPFEGYTPLRIECKSGGVFHPKIGIFIGEKRVTAIIGSGNLTYSGMSYNDEAWGAFSVSSAGAFEAPIISAVWHHLKGIIALQSLFSATLQLSWMLENSALLQQLDDMDSATVPVEDAFGESFEFVANTDAGSIFTRIVEAVGSDAVKKISICAPFYDIKGTALKNFLNALSPSEIGCLVHPEEGSLPTELDLKAFPNIRFFNYKVSGEKRCKMVHAKLIQLETASGTVLAIGSANASIQALGDARRGINDEADIIVKSSRKRDYLEDLGISRDEEIFDLTSFKKLEKSDDEKKTTPLVVIQCCELLEDGFHITIAKGPIEDVDLHMVDDFKKDSVQHLSLDNGVSVIPNAGGRLARTVFITKDGICISNKCIVLISSEIERKNPDKVMAPIARLLETAQDSADFERLLQYVHIEEETSTNGSVRLASSDGRKKEAGSQREFTDEDLDKKIFRNRQATLEQINDRILDRLAGLLFAAGDNNDYSEMPQDESTSQKDIDSGVPEEEEKPKGQRKNGKTPKEFSVMDEARGYFKKLLRHYDQLSWEKPDYDKVGPAILIQKPYYVQSKTDLAYSAVCIAVYEMLRIVKSGNQEEWNEMMEYFVSIVGAFLLIYREIPSTATAAAIQKITRKHRNLVLFSLLLVSFRKDYGQRDVLKKLLTLNLLDSFRDSIDDLKSVFAEYEELLDNNIIISDKESTDMVHQCYISYLNFIQHKDDYKKALSPSLDGVIVFRQSFGFLHVTNIEYSSRFIKERKYIVSNAFAPGFPEQVAILNNKSSIRGLISGVALTTSAYIFDK